MLNLVLERAIAALISDTLLKGREIERLYDELGQLAVLSQEELKRVREEVAGFLKEHSERGRPYQELLRRLMRSVVGRSER